MSSKKVKNLSGTNTLHGQVQETPNQENPPLTEKIDNTKNASDTLIPLNFTDPTNAVYFNDVQEDIFDLTEFNTNDNPPQNKVHHNENSETLENVQDTPESLKILLQTIEKKSIDPTEFNLKNQQID